MGAFSSGGGGGSGTDVIALLHFLSELQGGLAGGVLTAISLWAAVVAIASLAFCFWGYKLSKVLFAILCFSGGLFLGLAVVLGTSGSRGSVGVGLLVGAIIGAGLAYLSKYIYKALVFLVNAGVVVLLFVLFSSDNTMGVMSMLGVALGAVVGFFAVKYIRFSLILSTSLVYGLTAGTSILLVAGVVNPGLGLLLGAVLVAFGFHYQWKTTGGGSFKDYFLLRKTEAEQEKQAAHIAAKPHVTVNSGIVSTKGAAVPTDLLGVSFFSRAGVYALIPFAVALVLPLLPLGTVILAQPFGSVHEAERLDEKLAAFTSKF